MKRAIDGAVTGVTRGYTAHLELEGIGYQARIQEPPSVKSPPLEVEGQQGPRRGPCFLGGYVRLHPVVENVGQDLDTDPAPYGSGAGHLLLDVGFSNHICYEIPEKHVRIAPTRPQGPAKQSVSSKNISIYGLSYARTHEVAAEICASRKRSPYNAHKGIYNPNAQEKLFARKKPASSK
jgi:ribosomal protein L6P/L9E